MSDYMHHLTIPLSYDVQERKAARRKIIERAHKLERDSYKAMMQRRRQLQTKSDTFL
jgi:hypothetical protein